VNDDAWHGYWLDRCFGPSDILPFLGEKFNLKEKALRRAIENIGRIGYSFTLRIKVYFEELNTTYQRILTEW
jgi:hypothetical protein